MTKLTVLFAACLTLANAQVFKLTREQLVELTAQNPFERFPDGRPKVPDSLMQRARGMSAEEVWAVFARGAAASYRNQWEDGWQVLHPDKKMVGRAFTVQFMPARPDLDTVVNAKGRVFNQSAIDMVQPGDVLVIDLFGKGADGTIVGDNLFYYLMTSAKANGLVVDGAIRDLEGISEMAMPAYFRKTHPSALTNVTITGINVPIRIGNATVMPGDMVFGDKEGLYFIPPQYVQPIVDNADVIHIHDEWTRKKFDEGKYKSTDIYSSPKDPALQKEYKEYLEKRLKEIRK
jgi:regulator of RNase E activity RraA